MVGEHLGGFAIKTSELPSSSPHTFFLYLELKLFLRAYRLRRGNI